MEYHFEPATLGRDVTRLATELIFPPSNHVIAKQVQDLFIHHTLLGVAKRFEKSAEEIKEAFEHKFNEPMPETTLLVTSGVTLKGKVNNPRESFDKDAFIKAVAEKFDLSAQELHKMAEKTVKKSKPPVSLSTSYQGNQV